MLSNAVCPAVKYSSIRTVDYNSLGQLPVAIVSSHYPALSSANTFAAPRLVYSLGGATPKYLDSTFAGAAQVSTDGLYLVDLEGTPYANISMHKMSDGSVSYSLAGPSAGSLGVNGYSSVLLSLDGDRIAGFIFRNTGFSSYYSYGRLNCFVCW